MKKRILSILLAALMLFSLLPVTAFAGEGTTVEEASPVASILERIEALPSVEDFPGMTKGELQAVLDEVEAIFNLTDALTPEQQKQIDFSKLTAMYAAYNYIGSAPVENPAVLDYTELDAAITEAEKVDTSLYTEGSVEMFENALAAAKAIDRDLSFSPANQAAIKRAATELALAQVNLVLKVAPAAVGDYTIELPFGIHYLKLPFAGFVDSYSIENIELSDAEVYGDVIINNAAYYFSEDDGFGTGWFDDDYSTPSGLLFDSGSVLAVAVGVQSVTLTMKNPDQHLIADYSFVVDEEERIDNRLEFPTSGTEAFFYSANGEDAEPKKISEVFKFSEGAVPVRFDIFTVNSETNVPVILNNGRECEVIEDEGSEGTLTFADGAGDLELPHDEAFFIHIHDWTRTSEAHNCKTETTATGSTTIDHDTVMNICPVEFLEQKNGNTSQAHTAPLPCTACGGYGVSAADVTGGEASVTPTVAAKGDKVTVTGTPSDGYTLKSVSADQNVTPEKQEDGSYTFTMPAANVTVTAEFEAAQSETAEVKDAHGIIIQPAKGETKEYNRLATNTCFYDNSGIKLNYQSGTATMVECADGTVYWKDPVSEYTEGTWIKGKKEGSTITFATKQPVAYNDNYRASLSVRWGNFTTGRWTAADDYADSFIFDIAGDSLIMRGTQATMGTTATYFPGIFWDDDNSFLGYGDCGVTLTAAVPAITTWSALQEAINAAPGDGTTPATETTTIQLTQDLTPPATGATGITIPAGKNITLDLNGKVLNANDKNFSVITVVNGSKLTVIDSAPATEHKGYIDEDGRWHLGEPQNSETEKTIQGGIITGGRYWIYGGGVYVGGTFTLSAGTIAGNMAVDGGGGVHVDGGSFIMDGGAITSNTAKGGLSAYGGGVNIATGSFTMNGGSITGNTATNYGGGVFVDASCTFTMTDGSITGNSAIFGGGVQSGGTTNLLAAEGKTITITGNSATGAEGGFANWGEMHLSGQVIIKENEAPEGTPQNLGISTYSGPAIIDASLTGSEINVSHMADDDSCNTGVLTSGYTTKNSSAGLNDFFHYDGPGTNEMILNDSGELEVVARSNVYWYADADGKEVEVPTEATKATAAGGSSAVTWNTDWILVTGNVKIENAVTLSNDVNLILADGASLEITDGITSSSKTLKVYAQTKGDGKLTIEKTTSNVKSYGANGCNVTVYSGSVKISGSSNASNGYGVNKGAVTVYGGSVKISGSSNSYNGYGVYDGSTTVYGGSVEITGTGSAASGYGVQKCPVTVSDGNVKISGVSTSGDSGKFGIGVAEESAITVSGGIVEFSGTASAGQGRGVNNSNVTVTGGSVTITGTSSTNTGCGIYGFSKTVTVSGTGALTASGSTQATNLANDEIIAKVQTSSDGTNWTDWDEKTALTTYKYLKLTAYLPIVIDGITFQPWTKSDDLPTGGNWYLTKDVTLGLKTPMSINNNINLCLNDKVIDLDGKSIDIYNNRTFAIYDSGKTVRYWNKDANGLWTPAADQSKATDYYTVGGVITGGKNANYGGVLTVHEGCFTMYGGTICGNTASEVGGVLNYGTMTMISGAICGNTAATNNANYSGGIDNCGKLTIGGTAVVRDNFKNGVPSDVQCIMDGTLVLDKPAAGMKVGLTGTGTVVTGASADDLQYFFASDNANYKAYFDNSDNTIKLKERENKYWYVDEDGEEVEVESESKTTAVSESSAVTWDKDWVLATGNVKIDNTVTLANDVNLILADGAELEITGGITGTGKTLTVYGQTNGTGVLTVSKSDSGSVTAVSGSVTVNGGNVKISAVIGSKGTSSATGIDGNVTVNCGNVEIIGSTISDMAKGIGVNGDVKVAGGNAKITGNCTEDPRYGCGDGYGTSNGTITVTGGELTLNGSTKATSVGAEKINATVQYSDADDGKAYDKDWDGKTELTQKHLKLTKVPYQAQIEGEPVQQFETLTDAIKAAQAGDVIVLLSDCTETATLAQGESLKLKKNGHTYADSNVTTSATGYGVKAETDNVSGVTTYTVEKCLAKIGSTYHLTLADAVKAAQSGDTVLVLADQTVERLDTGDKSLTIKPVGQNVTLTLTGPMLLGVNGGSKTFTLSGGDNGETLTVLPKKSGDVNAFRPMAIRSGNTLVLKENVILTDSSFTGAGGGMINVASGATLDMQGGLIQNCKVISENYDNANVQMGRGGAVYVAQGGTFKLSGGEIKNCSATVAGGAVYVVGAMEMTGGKIDGCSVSGLDDGGTVKAKGGAVYLYGGSSFTMKDGEISGNTLGNVADMRGTGLYAASGANVTLGGKANIQNNKDQGGSGSESNIFLYDGAALGLDSPAAGMVIRLSTKTAPEFGAPVEIISSGAVSGDENYFFSEYPDCQFSFVPEGGKIILERIPYVAQIGSDKYLSFAEALAAAQRGDSVKLFRDVTTTENISIPSFVIFDLNHHTLTTTGTITNEGSIVLYQENADVIDYLLYQVPGMYCAGEELKLPTSASAAYVVPAGTVVSAEVGTSPAYQELKFALGDTDLVWNTDVPAGMQLRAVYALTLGGDILPAKSDGIMPAKVTATKLTLSDSIAIGGNEDGDGEAILFIESLDGDPVGTFTANDKKITLNRSGKVIVSSDVAFDASVLVSGVAGMGIYQQVDETEGTVTYYLDLLTARIDTTNYPSLAAALAAAKADETIVLLADNSETVTVSRAITFKVDFTGKNFDPENVTAGAGYSIKRDTSGNVTTFSVSAFSSGGAASTMTVPVSGNGNSVKVSATVSDGTAAVKPIKDAELAKVTGGEGVEIDLTGLNKEINTASLSTDTVKKIADKGGMTIDLSNAYISFNGDAVKEIANQAEGNTVEVKAEIIEAAKLNGKQKSAIKSVGNALVLDIDLISGGKKLCTEDLKGFNGGKATVSVPYDIGNKNPKNFSVYYIAEDGTLEKLDAKYDTKTGCFVFEIAHLSQYAIVYNDYTMPFVDVPEGEYYYDAVKWAAENDITKGTDATHFSPFVPVTRAQVVTFLWRAAGCPVVDYWMRLDDVKSGEYYTEAVCWALAEGITKGTSATTFDPDAICTRAQIVTFLARFAGVKDAETASVFTDVKSTDYFAAAVKWAKDNKVTEGTSATTFSPNTDCTRAQAVTFLYRWMVK